MLLRAKRAHGPSQGFTLLEIAIVIAVVGLLLAMLLPEMKRSREKARYARWQGFSNNLRTDPRLAAYYTFEFDKQERVSSLELENRAVGDPVDTEYTVQSQDGVIHGAVWTRNGGRWTGKTALEFDGQGTYVHVPDTHALDLSEEGTLEAWIYMISSTKDAGIIHKGDLKTRADEAYALRCSSQNKIVLAIRDQSQQRTVTSKASIAAGRWYHVVGTWDTSTMRIYINGGLDNSGKHSLLAMNTAGGLNIGAQLTEDSNPHHKNFPFNGKIGEVAIYNRALTEDDISSHYRMGSP